MKRAPKLNCKIGENLDGYELGMYRDKIGNVQVCLWKCGEGFKDKDFLVRPSHNDLKKMRDWLTKLIDYTERK